MRRIGALVPTPPVGKTQRIRLKCVDVYIYIIWNIYTQAQDLGSKDLGSLAGHYTRTPRRSGPRRRVATPSSWRMRRNYLVCNGCRQAWVWEDRLLSKPSMTCNVCGRQWKQQQLPHLRNRTPRKSKGKAKGIEKKLQEHWTSVPEALRTQLEAMGVKAAEPAPPPDLPTLIKEQTPSKPANGLERSS